MSVTVNCLNGRRQVVRVTPNTSALEILETVCEKQKLDPKEYELLRNNKPIDLSLTIRFANIPNNGQLDLRQATTKRCDEKVTLAIDLETGERKVHDFETNHNLWDIIHQIFAGNPILNFDQNMELCVIYIGKEIYGEQQLKQTNLKSLGLLRGRAVMRLVVRAVNSSKTQAFVEALVLPKPQSLPKNVNTNQTEVKVTQKPQQPPPESHPQPPPPLELQSQPQPSEPQTSNYQQMDVKQEVPQNNNTITNEVKHIEEDKCEDMEVESDFDESCEVINYLGDNNSGILFKMSDLPKVSKIEFPDDFYVTTKDDLVSVLKGLRQQQIGENENMLETKRMKEQKKLAERQRYKSTVIRILFPTDKLIFQAIFKPDDTVDTIMKTISSYVIPNEFYLYTVPPKCQLKAGTTLLDSNLVPAAVIHFGSDSVKREDNAIKQEFREKISSYKWAAKIAFDSRKSLNKTVTDVISDVPSAPVTQTQNSNEKESTNGPKDKKIPKWFKSN